MHKKCTWIYHFQTKELKKNSREEFNPFSDRTVLALICHTSNWHYDNLTNDTPKAEILATLMIVINSKLFLFVVACWHVLRCIWVAMDSGQRWLRISLNIHSSLEGHSLHAKILGAPKPQSKVTFTMVHCEQSHKHGRQKLRLVKI